MADGVSDGGNGDEPLILSTPVGRPHAESFDEAMGETVEVLERKQKILAKIICTPGKKTFIADMMKKMFSILLEADPAATITSVSGLVVTSVKSFPTGSKFESSFKPIQSNDTKSVKMVFELTTAPSLNQLKGKYVKLMDHLQSNNMYLDESFSGSNNEELIGYFLGFQADKVHLAGFADDLRELLTTMPFQDGETKIGLDAHAKLPWDQDKAPPFQVRVRNITRKDGGAEYSSKAVGIIVAEEHSAFYKTILTRAFGEKLLPGLGRWYNCVPNDRLFYRAIKWNNDQIDKTAVLPILGISRIAMLQPLKAARAGKEKESIVSSIRSEICNSGYFATIHSTKFTHTEGRWMLIVADKAKVQDATKYINSMMQSIYDSTNSQIPSEARIMGILTPTIESKAQTIARSNPINRQGSAWGTTLTTEHEVKGGSRMRNMAKPRNRGGGRKIVELSFDPESTIDFPHLKSEKKPTNKAKARSTTGSKESKSESSASDTISAVTKEDFETLGNNLREMLRSEAQSVLSSGTDVTMISLLRDELTASREQSKIQMEMMNRQMTMFHTMMTTMNPNMPTQAEIAKMTPPTDPATKDSESIDSATPSEDTVQTQTTCREEVKKRASRSQTKVSNVEYNVPKYSNKSQEHNDPITQPPSQADTNYNESMNDPQQHTKPVSSPGMTPQAKKTKSKHGSNATSLQARTLEDGNTQSRRLDNEFAELQSFHQSTNSEGAAGGAL
jgi:hypothetical protein